MTSGFFFLAANEKKPGETISEKKPADKKPDEKKADPNDPFAS